MNFATFWVVLIIQVLYLGGNFQSCKLVEIPDDTPNDARCLCFSNEILPQISTDKGRCSHADTISNLWVSIFSYPNVPKKVLRKMVHEKPVYLQSGLRAVWTQILFFKKILSICSTFKSKWPAIRDILRKGRQTSMISRLYLCQNTVQINVICKIMYL